MKIIEFSTVEHPTDSEREIAKTQLHELKSMYESLHGKRKFLRRFLENCRPDLDTPSGRNKITNLFNVNIKTLDTDLYRSIFKFLMTDE